MVKAAEELKRRGYTILIHWSAQDFAQEWCVSVTDESTRKFEVAYEKTITEAFALAAYKVLKEEE